MPARVLRLVLVLLFVSVPMFAAEHKASEGDVCLRSEQAAPDASQALPAPADHSSRFHAVAMDGPGDLQQRDPGTTGCQGWLVCWYTTTYIGDNYVSVSVDCSCV